MKIYIAGPDVFRADAETVGINYKRFLNKYGHEGLYPLDNQYSTAAEIIQGNYNLIDDCDLVIANCNSFRGLEPDSGTCCEIGYAIAKGKKIICYLDDNRSQVEKIGAVDKNGYYVEDFNYPINIMMAAHKNVKIINGDFYTAVMSII